MKKFVLGDYTAEQVINKNPYLFYGMNLYMPDNHPKRLYNKKIWAIYLTSAGMNRETSYTKTKKGAISFIKKMMEIKKRLDVTYAGVPADQRPY